MAVNSRNENPLVVDLSSRTISIPDELKYIGVATDNNSEKVWFSVPRYFDEPDVQGNGDLLEKIAQVHFLNAGGSFGVYTISETVDNGDGTISLAWLVGKDVTMVAGDVKFQLVFTLFDNGDNVYKLSTTPATLVVRAGIDTSDFSIAQESKTYEQLIELIYDGYETLKAVDMETLRNLSASPKRVVSSLELSTFETLETGLYLYIPDDVNDEYYGYIVYWNGLTVSDPIIKYLTASFSNGCIETAHIADNAVTNDKLASNAVSTAKIADSAVTSDKLATNSVTNTKLSDNAVTIGKLENAKKVCENNDEVDFGVTDVVDAYEYVENADRQIGVTDDGRVIFRKTIDRYITNNEITLGYIDSLFDVVRVVHKIISVDLYMVSDDGTLVPLNFQYEQDNEYSGNEKIYLNGIVCESDGVYKVKPASDETWILRGSIIYSSNLENEVVLL